MLETLRGLFPDKGDLIKERRLSKLHKIVLGILPLDIEGELRTRGLTIDIVDVNGFTALMWAARRGDSIAVDLLIKGGANVNLETDVKWSALIFAAYGADSTCVKLLLEAGANHLQVNFQGDNALHYAAQNSNNRDIIRLLVERGVDLEARTTFGGTPLMASAHSNKIESATALLDFGADINVVDDDGDNALYNAIYLCHDDMTQLLLHRGAAYTQINKTGYSILHFLAASGGLRMLDVLLAAELKDIDTEAVNKNGKTAFQIAKERVDKPEGFVEKFRELLVDIRARNAQLERTGARNNSSIGDESRGPLQLNLVRLAWARPSWIRFTNWKAHVRRQVASHFQHFHHRQLKNYWSAVWNSISIYWIMGLFLVVIMYPYLGTTLDIAKQILILVWNLAGPGEMAEL